jgi:DeoR/GlpR family transcriptional regulator of sugar metabolism
MELLAEKGEADVNELAAELNVCGMTIRRDLDALALIGKVIRSHGGAAISGRVVFDFQFMQRTREHEENKQKIAETAASLVKNGQSILLDSGTTTLAVARALKAKKNLTVITTSLPIASELQNCDQITLILLGGALRREAPDLIGPLTESNLEVLKADIAFIGADAVDTNGQAFNCSMAVARMLSRMSTAARQVYVVADSTKIGKSALALIGNVNSWKGLITDHGLPPAHAAALKHAGCVVIQPTTPSRPAATPAQQSRD